MYNKKLVNSRSRINSHEKCVDVKTLLKKLTLFNYF